MALQIYPERYFRKALRDSFEADDNLMWAVVPCTFYTPQEPKKPTLNEFLTHGEGATYSDIRRIGSYHKVQAPITVTRELVADPSDGRFAELLQDRLKAIPEGHEMALGVTWMCGFKDTTTKYGNAQIFDGAPGLNLNDLPKKVTENLGKFTILSTGNGYHFYLKNNPLEPFNVTMQSVQNRLIDKKWDDFRRITGGYIRVTSYVKGSILL